jgi:hypothetical protein
MGNEPWTYWKILAWIYWERMTLDILGNNEPGYIRKQ